MGFLGMSMCLCLLCFLYFGFFVCFLLYLDFILSHFSYSFILDVCLFSDEKEKEKVWIWMGVEDLGRAEEGETVIRIYCVFSITKKEKEKGKN